MTIVEVHDLVKEWAPKLRDRELAAMCNEKLGTSFTAQSMKAFRGNHGYRGGRRKPKGPEYWTYQTEYPQGMFEFIRDNSQGVSSREMAEVVNEKFGTNWTAEGMKQFRSRYGIKSGVSGCFEKGHIPVNKGKTLDEFIGDPERVAEIKSKMAGTQFRKGEAPSNTLPVGTVVINSDGYKVRKRQPKGTQWERWEFLHRAVWEEHNGPVPDGMVVSFRDGNRMNCDIGNLMLITKAEHAAMTALGYRSEDPELTDAGLAVIRLKQAAKDAKKKRRG